MFLEVSNDKYNDETRFFFKKKKKKKKKKNNCAFYSQFL